MLRRLENLATGLSMAVLVFLAVLVPLDAFMRYTVRTTIQGLYELTTVLLLGALAFLPLATSIRKQQHPRVLIVYDRLPKRIQQYLDIVVRLLITVLCFAFAYSLLIRAIESVERNEVSPVGLGMPLYVGYGVILFAFALACIRTVTDLVTRREASEEEAPPAGV